MLSDREIHNRAGERLDHTFHPGSRADALVVIGHGVTGNKDRPHLVALADELSRLGWPCLRFSFSGNGESGGRFEESTISKEIGDLQAVLKLVPDDARVIYVGHSMGGAVGVLAAARDPRIQALVSLAGMTYTAEFCEREFGDVKPGEGCMWDEPDCPLSQAFVDDMHQIGTTLDAAAAVTQPWLLVHGTADDVVPIRDGLAARDAAGSETDWVEIDGAGHSFEGHHAALAATVREWLDKQFATA